MESKTKFAKKIIEDYEYNTSGIKYDNGAYAQAVNIRIRKDKVIADVKIIRQMDGRTERYDDVEYPISLFKTWGV